MNQCDFYESILLREIEKLNIESEARIAKMIAESEKKTKADMWESHRVIITQTNLLKLAAQRIETRINPLIEGLTRLENRLSNVSDQLIDLQNYTNASKSSF